MTNFHGYHHPHHWTSLDKTMAPGVFAANVCEILGLTGENSQLRELGLFLTVKYFMDLFKVIKNIFPMENPPFGESIK